MSNSSQLSRYNKTDYPLDAGNTFTGIGENTAIYQGVHVNIESDQSCELTLEWSNDNQNWYWNDVINITGGTGYSGSFHNKGLYYRIRINNNSGSNMTRLTALSRYISDVVDTSSLSITSVPSYNTYLWNNATILAGDTSSVADLNHVSNIDIVGNTDGAVNLDVQLSHDNTNWYESMHTVVVTGGGDWHVNLGDIGARYLRLKSDGGVTITAHLGAKH